MSKRKLRHWNYSWHIRAEDALVLCSSVHGCAVGSERRKIITFSNQRVENVKSIIWLNPGHVRQIKDCPGNSSRTDGDPRVVLRTCRWSWRDSCRPSGTTTQCWRAKTRLCISAFSNWHVISSVSPAYLLVSSVFNLQSTSIKFIISVAHCRLDFTKKKQ